MTVSGQDSFECETMHSPQWEQGACVVQGHAAQIAVQVLAFATKLDPSESTSHVQPGLAKLALLNTRLRGHPALRL